MELPLLLAVVFFVTALVMYVAGFRIRDREDSVAAVAYAVVFQIAGLVALFVWRVTS